jgi:hypothetical protein
LGIVFGRISRLKSFFEATSEEAVLCGADFFVTSALLRLKERNSLESPRFRTVGAVVDGLFVGEEDSDDCIGIN